MTVFSLEPITDNRRQITDNKKMELKEKLISSFMAFEERVDVNDSLHDIRINAMKNFENNGFPTKKEEA